MKKKILLTTLITIIMLLLLSLIIPNVAKAAVTGTRYYTSGNTFDIRGVIDNSTEISTTYSNGGYKVILNVDGNEASMGNSGVVEKNGVTLTLSGTSDGNLTFNLVNSTSESKTVKVAIDADIMLGGNDSAALYKNGHSSISITQDNEGISNYGAQVVITFSPEVTTSWIGYYGNRGDNRYVDGTVNAYTYASSVDTGLAFSWTINLEAEETKQFGTVYNAQEATRAVAKADGEVYANVLLGGTVTTPNLPENPEGYTYYWNTNSDGTGTSYNARETIIVSEEETNIYSVAVPNVYTVNLDNQGATNAGTDKIYETYNTKYSLTETGEAMQSGLNPIEVPSKDDGQFVGYFTTNEDDGVKYIDENGYLTEDASTTFFTSSGTLYAKYLPFITGISFDGYDGEYDGTPKELTVNGDTSGCELLYSTDGSNFSSTVPQYTDAGNYKVYYKVKKSGFADLTGNATINITPKTLSADDIEVSPEEETVTCTEVEIEVKPIVKLKDGTVIPSSEYTVQYENNINVGTATILIADAEGGNYILPDDLSTTFNIIENTKPKNPKTSDNGITLWTVMAFVSMMGLVRASLMKEKMPAKRMKHAKSKMKHLKK